MPKYTNSFGEFGLDGEWEKRLERDIERLMRTSAAEWLRAVILRVPVWSGMARGTLKWAEGNGSTLAAFLRVAVPIDPVHSTPKKNEHSGKGSFYFQKVSRNRYEFSFRTEAVHYQLNEFFERYDADRVKQQIVAPWGSMRAGDSAWRRYVDSEIQSERFFKIVHFLTKSRTRNLVDDTTTSTSVEVRRDE
jgi:hypothetical protein